MAKIKILQFISPTGMYGAEYWILALIKNLDPTEIQSHIAAPIDTNNQTIELLKVSRNLGFKSKTIQMKGKFDPLVIFKLYKILKAEK